MDLYQLKYFLEVARERNFSKAAGNLGISPPAVSKSVALLERSLGKKLFQRTRRRVELTAAGGALKQRVESAFDTLERGRQEALGEAAFETQVIRVGSREMITNYLLPEALKEIRAEYPETRFGIYELDPRVMAEELKKDRIDFALYYSTDLPDRELEIEHLGSMVSHVYAAKKLLRGRKGISRKEVLALPFVAPRYYGSDSSLPSMDGFPDSKQARNIVFEAEFLETHLQFVMRGLAAGVIPDFLMRDALKRGKVARLPGPPLGREIYFLKRRRRPLPKAVEIAKRVIKRSL